MSDKTTDTSDLDNKLRIALERQTQPVVNDDIERIKDLFKQHEQQAIKAELTSLLAKLPDDLTFEYAGTNNSGGVYKTMQDGVAHGYNQGISTSRAVIQEAITAIEKGKHD